MTEQSGYEWYCPACDKTCPKEQVEKDYKCPNCGYELYTIPFKELSTPVTMSEPKDPPIPVNVELFGLLLHLMSQSDFPELRSLSSRIKHLFKSLSKQLEKIEDKLTDHLKD